MKFIKNQFTLANKYMVKELGVIFLAIYALFILGCVASYFTVRFLPEDFANILMAEMEAVFDSAGVVDEAGNISFLMLFLNNSRVGLMLFLTGFVPFIFIPLGISAFNAVIIGVVVGAAEITTGVNAFLMVVTSILPHGIFEITAIVLSASAGTRLCIALCKKIFRKGKDEKILTHIKRYAALLVIYIIPLLFIAAIIEGVVLPALADLIMNVI